MEKKREVWVDKVKVIACILVVLGHFFQSMVKSGIISYSAFYDWFNTTIYYFHVPLFFICSGYLFQKYSKVRNLTEWKNNVVKKFVVLGVPYFVFTILTWLLKNIFSSSVNSDTEGLFETLFITPTSPYWYLYILFFVFVTAWTIESDRQAWFLGIAALAIKITGMCINFSEVFLLAKFADNYIWFVAGMLISYGIIKRSRRAVGGVCLALFLGISVLIYVFKISFFGLYFLIGALACYSILSIVSDSMGESFSGRLWNFCSRYTMPVFLMHTMLAAPLRAILIKVGISNVFIHIAFGLIISFCGPIIAMIVLEKLKPLDFIVYPGRYVHFKKNV